MGADEEPKGLILKELSDRKYAYELNKRFVENHLEADIVTSTDFLLENKINYAIYHEPNMAYMTHIPAWIVLDNKMSKLRRSEIGKDEVEEARQSVKRLSVCLTYDSPKVLRDKIESEFFDRKGFEPVRMDKILQIENLHYFPYEALPKDKLGRPITALQQAIGLPGAININDVVITITLKETLDETARGLSTAHPEKDKRIYRLMYLHDPLIGKKPN